MTSACTSFIKHIFTSFFSRMHYKTENKTTEHILSGLGRKWDSDVELGQMKQAFIVKFTLEQGDKEMAMKPHYLKKRKKKKRGINNEANDLKINQKNKHKVTS